MELQVFIEKHETSRHYMWRSLQVRSAVRNTDWAEEKIKTVPHMFCDSAEVYTCNWHDGKNNNFMNNLRTIEA